MSDRTAPAAGVRVRQLLGARLGQSVAVADFNGDGVSDVAVTEFLTDAVTLFIGDPVAGFTQPTRLAAGRGPRAVVAADLNDDGLIDLAVGEFLSGSVRVFLGRGDGGFATPLDSALAPGVSALVAHDVDGDGRVELAAANALSGRIVLGRQAGGGTLDWADLGGVRAPTLLLVEDLSRDGTRDLIAVDAEGRTAWVFAGDPANGLQGAQRVDPARIDGIAGAALDTLTTSAARLTKLGGDAQTPHVGSIAGEPLVVGVRDAAGSARAGEAVIFARLAGEADLLEPGVLGSVSRDTRALDENGRASVNLRTPPLPDATVIAASLPSDGLTTFRMATHTRPERLASLIAAALADEGQDARSLIAYRAVLRDAVRRLDQGDALTAIRGLVAVLDRMSMERLASTPAGASGVAEDLTKRFLNQILLLGPSPQVADNEPIACDVPLTRSIEVATEVDRFTFPGVAGERVHITMANEATATGAFGIWWRLLNSDGIGVAGCNTFGLSRDCTLPSTDAAYAIEVEDASHDGTGTYSLLIQRLTAGQRCGTAITCDVPASTTISARVDTDIHEFAGVAGERVHITMANEATTTGAFGVWWRLLASDGTGVAGCNTFGLSRDCTLPATDAAYAIEVEDAAYDGTGTYSVLIQRLTAGQRCGTGITCDVPATTTISTRVDTDIHEFAGVAGERVHIVMANEATTTGAFGVWWRLLKSDGTGVAGCNAFGLSRDCTLPATDAAYAIEVEDASYDGTGTYSVLIQRLTAGQRCGTAITCDVPASTTISARVDTDIHEFAGVAGERVHITMANEVTTSGAFGVWWRLLASDGTGVAGCNTFGLSRDCTLPATDAAYAIEVEDASYDGTGTYSVLIQRLTAGHRCGAGITCDVPATTTISTRLDTDLHEFAGVAGERLHITMANEVSASGAFGVWWRLLASDGTGVAGCNTFGVSRDCTLPATDAAYAIEVEDAGYDGTGTYSLLIQRLTAGQRCGAAITCDVPATTTISARVDTDIHEFAGVAGERVHIAMANEATTTGAFAVWWRLLNPDGSPVAGCNTFSGADRDCTLPPDPGCDPSTGCTLAPGLFAIEVEDASLDGTGTYSLHIQRLTAPKRCGAAACDVATTASISARADTDVYDFTGGTGEQVQVAVSNQGGTASFNPVWRLVAPDGTGVAGCSTFSSATRDCTLPTQGAYAVEVEDSGFNGTGNYAVSVTRAVPYCLPPSAGPSP